MKTLKVEKVFSKKVEYERNGEHKSFMKYSVASGNVWYDLKGVGIQDVKEGDTITGLYTESDWSRGGKSGVNRTIELAEPEIQIKEPIKDEFPSKEFITTLVSRIEALEEAVFTTGNNDTNNDLLF